MIPFEMDDAGLIMQGRDVIVPLPQLAEAEPAGPCSTQRCWPV
jgi:hypothetical protein